MKRFCDAYRQGMDNLHAAHPMPKALRDAATNTRNLSYGWVKYAVPAAACAVVLLGVAVIAPRILNKQSFASSGAVEYAAATAFDTAADYAGAADYTAATCAGEEELAPEEAADCVTACAEAPMEVSAEAEEGLSLYAAPNGEDTGDYGLGEESEGALEAAGLTDGERVCYLSEGTLYIARRDGTDTEILSQTDCVADMDGETDFVYSGDIGLLLREGKAVVLLSGEREENGEDGSKDGISVLIYDVTDPTAPRLIASSKKDGFVTDGQLTDSVLSAVIEGIMKAAE